ECPPRCSRLWPRCSRVRTEEHISAVLSRDRRPRSSIGRHWARFSNRLPSNSCSWRDDPCRKRCASGVEDRDRSSPVMRSEKQWHCVDRTGSKREYRHEKRREFVNEQIIADALIECRRSLPLTRTTNWPNELTTFRGKKVLWCREHR